MLVDCIQPPGRSGMLRMDDSLRFEVRFQIGSFLLTGPTCDDGIPFGTARDAWSYWRREFAAGGESLLLVHDSHDVLYASYQRGPVE